MTPLTIPSLATVWSCPCTSTVALRADITPRCCGRRMDDEGETLVPMDVDVDADVEGNVEGVFGAVTGEPVPEHLYRLEDVTHGLVRARRERGLEAA